MTENGCSLKRQKAGAGISTVPFQIPVHRSENGYHEKTGSSACV